MTELGFNINNQTAGVVNNVEGNQYVRGGQHAEMVHLGDARSAVQELEAGIDSLSVDEKDYAEISAELQEIKSEISRINPQPDKVAGHLKRITEVAGAVGAVAGLAGPIQTLVAWLGPLGQPIGKLFTGML